LAFERCGGPEGPSISDIVKRKHIRSNRSTGDGNGRTDSDIRSPITVAGHRLEHLSRGPRLTARLPDVFEAKLVFSNQRTDDGRRTTEGDSSVLCRLSSAL
jgi:hypothetical protein